MVLSEIYNKNFFFIVSGRNVEDPTFIRFNFENFRPNYHGKMDGSETQVIYERMLPPGELIYFYTLGETFSCEAKDHPTKDNHDLIMIDQSQFDQ